MLLDAWTDDLLGSCPVLRKHPKMRVPSRSRRAIRFGAFAADMHAGELYRDGAKVRLQEQPFSVLRMLLQRHGELVTREELCEKLWPNGTFVDFDHGINVAVAKIREALGDSSEEPQFVETVGRRGYRFIGPIESAPGSSGRPFALSARRHSVGREKERAELAAAFGSVDAAHGVLVCVAGEPGIGKTTLVQDFLSDLHASGKSFGLAIGRCSQRLAGEEAYLPFLEALDSLLRGDGGIAHKLRDLAPSWYAQLFPPSGCDPFDAGLQEYLRATTQERMKRELAAFFNEVTRQEPLVLFFDDVHWADPSTVDLLTYLATKFGATRILVVVAYRPSELFLSKSPFIEVKRDLEGRGVCCEIDVEFLSTTNVKWYLDLEFPGNCFPDEFASLIHSRTEGNPLFMVDLLRYLRDRKVIVKEEVEQSWRVAQSLPDLSRDFPQSVRSMIERKIEQVNVRDREVLTAAAVQGYEFDSATVARGLEAEDVEIEEVLDRLDRVHAFVGRVEDHGLPSGVTTVRYRFVHVLYQNALYASLTPSRRAALSVALAHALEALYGDRSSSIASQLGFLYETARDPGRASDYFRLAAMNAARIFAYQEAIALARRGLALLQSAPDNPERARKELDLQITLALALQVTRGYWVEESLATITRARELCQRLGDASQLSGVLFSLWLNHIGVPDVQKARQIAEQFLEIALGANDPSMLLMAHGIMGVTMQHQGELAEARKQFDEGLRYHDPADYEHYLELYKFEPGIYGRSESVRNLWMLGYPDQARRRSEETLALARTIPSPPASAFVHLLSAMLYQNLRQPENARQMGEACIAICEEHGVAMERANVTFAYGWALAELGHVEEGISQIRGALDAQHATGGESNRPQYVAFLAEIYWHAGQAEEGLNAVEDGLAMSKRTGDIHYNAELWRLKGEFFKMQGKTTEAESCFQRAIEIARQQAAKSLELRACTSLARLWQKNRKPTEGQRLLSEVYSWFTEGFETADLQEAASLLKELS